MISPVVAHFVRGFLRPTETFIGNQIINLQKFTPVVFCHHRINGHSYDSINPIVLIEKLPYFQRIIQTYSYKYFRLLAPSAVNFLISQIQESKTQLLHFHYLVDARFFLPFLKKLELPSLVSGYGWDVSLFPRTKCGYGRIYLQPIFNNVDIFLAMSEDMKKDMIKLGCPEEKIIVHYYGSDTTRFQYQDRSYEQKDKIKILFCGRLAPKKAPYLILYALKKLEEMEANLPQWELIIVGEGPLKEKLFSIVNEYKWNNRVIFRGHIPHHEQRLVDEYKNADIYIQPSITANGEKEGIPGTLVEAMSSGLPCIATYHAGIPSIIEDKVHGLLFRENDVYELAEKIKLLISDNKLREYLGKNAAKKAIIELNLKEKTKEL